MKNTLMGTETVPTEGFHLVQKLYSFLDIPGAAWDLVLLIYLFCCSKRPSRVRAAPQREISDLGFSSDLSQCGDLVSVRRFRHSGAKQANRSDSDLKSEWANCRFKRRMEVSPFETAKPVSETDHCQGSAKPSANQLGFFLVLHHRWKRGGSAPFPKSRNPGFTSTKRVRLVMMVEPGMGVQK